MRSSQLDEIIERTFRIAFRIGESRAEERHERINSIPKDNELRYATREEIAKEASSYLEKVSNERETSAPILLVNVLKAVSKSE